MTETHERVLLVHNKYQQRGGEDAVFEAESALLERYGHHVERLIFDNASISNERSLVATAGLAASTIWSRASLATLTTAIERSNPSVVHVHNSFPLVSPAGYYAAKRQGVRTVQTLHNYRLICPGALLFRDGGPCEDCIGKTLPYPGIRHGCYRESHAQSATVAAMTTAHRIAGTWKRQVDRYIALTEFSKQKFIAGGLPAGKIVVKPNFLDSVPPPGDDPRDGFVFVGRLVESKGIDSLVSTWTRHAIQSPLRIAGSGPLEDQVAHASHENPSITPLGMLSPEQVLLQMRTARALIYPSIWYENFPMTLVEAFASGLPVIATRLGAMAEIIKHGHTGLHYTPGNGEELRDAVRWASEHPDEMQQMGRAAREEYETRYSGEQNYQMLRNIYGWH